MSKLDIPESWVEATLGDLCDGFQYGINASSAPTGQFKLLRITDLDDSGINWDSVPSCKVTVDEAQKYLLKDGDIVIARSGSIGKTAIIRNPPPNAIFASYLIRLRLKNGVKNWSMLRNYFDSPLFQGHIISRAKGATQKNVNTEALKESPFVIAPIEEQKRIGAKIESTQSKIAEIESCATRAEELIEKYREALLLKAFRGELVQQNPNDESAIELLKRTRSEQTKYSDGTKRKKDDLPPMPLEDIPFTIPKSWEWVRLENVIEEIEAGWSPQCEPFSRNSESEWAVLKISAVTWGEFEPDENKVLPKKLKPKEELEVNAGDVIISRANTLELVGRGVLVKKTPPKLLLNDKLLRLKFGKAIHPDFYILINNSKMGRAYFESVASGTSSSMRNITRDEVRRMPVPLPPLEEQVRVAAEVKRLEIALLEQQKLFTHVLTLGKTLGSSILNSAFCGRLVPQIDSEGSGHNLLLQMMKQTQVKVESVNQEQVQRAKFPKRKK